MFWKLLSCLQFSFQRFKLLNGWLFLRSWRKMWELCMGLGKKKRVSLAITLQRQKCKTLETVFWCKLRCVNVDLFLPWCEDRIAFMLLIPQCFGKNDGTKTWLWESTCQGQRFLEKDCGKLSTPSKAWKTPCLQKFFRMLFMEWASQKEPKKVRLLGVLFDLIKLIYLHCLGSLLVSLVSLIVFCWRYVWFLCFLGWHPSLTKNIVILVATVTTGEPKVCRKYLDALSPTRIERKKCFLYLPSFSTVSGWGFVPQSIYKNMNIHERLLHVWATRHTLWRDTRFMATMFPSYRSLIQLSLWHRWRRRWRRRC